MRALLRQVANRLWYLSCRLEAAAFTRDLGEIAVTQEQLLMDMLRRNRSTDFGREHGFATIMSAREYQQAVPLGEYGDFLPAIERIRTGEANVLTAEPVLLLEPTGGSCGGSKLIPYTASLKRQFQRGIAPWIADLYHTHPELLRGESYWSVTPVVIDEQASSGAIRVGFADDSEYLGGVGRLLVRSVQAVPDQVKRVANMDSFWYLTLLFLLRSRDLSLISVWNPTFLTILVDHLESWWSRLADDIASGSLSPPVALDPAIAGHLIRQNRPDTRRAEEIRQAWAKRGGRAEVYRALWPRLRLISCWQDGAAAAPAEQLGSLFPDATIQGKGLIATEGFFTLPHCGIAGCLPAFRSHFLEFLPQGGGEIRMLHQLETDRIYSLVVTTAGGLYRYRLHDLVRVTGFHRGVPLFRFMGKEGYVSDHFGEKLHDEHVHTVIRNVSAAAALRPLFGMLAYEQAPVPAYVFFVEAPNVDDRLLIEAGAQIDALLMDNFQYRYCRQLGQLAPIRVFRISRSGQETYLRTCCSQGQRLGAVKALSLHRTGGWAEAFHGQFIGEHPHTACCSSRKDLP